MDERILLDAQTGVGTYARALHAAQRCMAEGAELVCDRRNPSGAIPAPFGKHGRRLRALWPNTRSAEERAGRHFVADVFRLAQVHFDLWGRPLRVRLSGSPGIVHWSYPLPIHVVDWCNVYTIHDAIPLTASSLTPIDPRRHRRMIAALAEGAAAFVTVSDATKAELASALNTGAISIVNCGQAVSIEPATAARLPAGLTPHGYWLVVGSVETRKNIPSIVAAHARSGTALPLVIAGPDGWGADAIAPLLSAPGIVRLPFLPRGQLIALMAKAKALLMVSLAEGFGLPIIEAMSLGTPVITSNRNAQAEVADGAALLVNPDDPSAIAAALQRLAEDDSLRCDLAHRGYIRAADFKPDRFQERLAAFYVSIADPQTSASIRFPPACLLNIATSPIERIP